jgi:hypothetical protein
LLAIAASPKFYQSNLPARVGTIAFNANEADYGKNSMWPLDRREFAPASGTTTPNRSVLAELKVYVPAKRARQLPNDIETVSRPNDIGTGAVICHTALLEIFLPPQFDTDCTATVGERMAIGVRDQFGYNHAASTAKNKAESDTRLPALQTVPGLAHPLLPMWSRYCSVHMPLSHHLTEA